MDNMVKKNVLRLCTYGLYALTAREGDEFGMMTINFLTQSSFTPPMIAVAMEKDSNTRRLVEKNGHFAVNIFSREQRELAGLLGRKNASKHHRMDGVSWSYGPSTGAPIIDQVLGWLECRVEGRILSGDHTLYVAEVIGAGGAAEGEPLTMLESGFRHSG